MAGQRLRPVRPHPPEHQLEQRFGSPPLPPHTVFRPRLFDALERGCAKPLTLVSAPAGTGKTVAVASWLARDVVRPGVAWISLTENALAGGSLLALMAEALLPAGTMGGSGATPWTHAPTVANIVRGLRQRSGPVSLVLDCDVAITREEALQVHRILDGARDTLRMILISRADPPLPLHRYRLDDDIVEIRMNQLAFTAIEAGELLNRGGFDLPQAAVQLVMARTQGWAAGLLLAAMSLATRSDAVRAAQDLTGASGPVAEYLLAEVLNVQTPAIRTLLLRTSIVDELDRGVSEALAGDRAPAALVFLARGNAFLEEVTGSPGCYRYHPLFRELLLAQLRMEAPTELTRLHRIAAAWCSEHAQVGEAVRHAAQAGAWDEAARYVLDNLAVIRILKPAARDELGDVLTRMPREVSGVAPALVRAALLLRAGQAERAGRHLDIARQGLAPSSDDDAGALALALLTVAHASRSADYAALTGAVVLARRLSDRWTTGDALSRLGLESMLIHAHAKVCFIEGRWDAALEAYTRIASGNVRAEDWPEVMDSIGHLALIAAWRGQNRDAVRLAREALSVETDTTNGSRSWAAAAAEAALAWVGVETCDVPCAKRHLANVESSLSSEVDLVTQVAAALVRSRVAGPGYRARRVLSTFLASHVGLPAWIIDLVTVELAAIELMGAAANDATSMSDDSPAPVREMASVVRTWGLLVVDASGNTRPPAVGDRSDSVTARVQRLVLTALWWLRRNDDDQAAKALQQALALAETENLRRPFREAPVEVRRMLRSHPDIAGCQAWLSARDGSEALSDAGEGRRPLRAVPPDPDRSSGNLLEPLTEREMQVLTHLGQLLTTDEIAAEMFVSVNTIRTHVRNILRKLSVSRRNEAIRRAREHGILQ